MALQQTDSYRERFLQAFKLVWAERLEKERKTLEIAYLSDPEWTKYMIHGTSSLLYEVMTTFSRTEPAMELDYRQEWYTLDALFIGGEDLFRAELCYPSQLHVLIEHEHGDHLEEEIWKLVHWRAPLKVIIGYDWNDEDKNTSVREQWRQAKLDALKRITAKVNEFHAEADNVSYLMLLANRAASGGEIRWHWSGDDLPNYQLLVGGFAA